MSRWDAVSWAVILTLTGATPAHPQGLRGTFSARGNVIELRDLARDSLPADQVPGADIRRRLEDGTVASCIPDEFCRWYATGDRRSVSLVTQELVVAGWPGLEGVSGHAHIRSRYGSDDFWPRSEEEVEVIAAYASWDRGDPLEFRLGVGMVIQGWDEGIAGMKVGGRRRLTIPAHKAYGDRGAGGVIKPGATLVFVVDLVGVR